MDSHNCCILVGSAFNLGAFKGDNCILAWSKYIQVEQMVDSRTSFDEALQMITEGNGNGSGDSALPRTAQAV